MEESREVNKVSEQKIEQFWRDATADDVARVWHGKAVEARFRDSENTSWHLGKLNGWSAGVFICDRDDWWQQCQVYDPPGCYVNKPEPGEGWRLLEKFPHENLQDGDEKWSKVSSKWVESSRAIAGSKVQCENVWYRRRIETNSPISSDSSTAENTSEAPNGSRSRNTIPRGWRLLGKDEERLASDAYWSLVCKEWIVLGDDMAEYANDKTRKWHAIRQVEHQVDYALVDGYIYHLPNGQTIRITAKGFEVG
jgi:hypothetical protein